jgi:hypothetical protein
MRGRRALDNNQVLPRHRKRPILFPAAAAVDTASARGDEDGARGCCKIRFSYTYGDFDRIESRTGGGVSFLHHTCVRCAGSRAKPEQSYGVVAGAPIILRSRSTRRGAPAGTTPRRAVATEDIRDLQGWRHDRGLLRGVTPNQGASSADPDRRAKQHLTDDSVARADAAGLSASTIVRLKDAWAEASNRS